VTSTKGIDREPRKTDVSGESGELKNPIEYGDGQRGTGKGSVLGESGERRKKRFRLVLTFSH